MDLRSDAEPAVSRSISKRTLGIFDTLERPCIPLPSARTDSNVTFELIQQRMSAYEQNHERCFIPKTDRSQLPRQLIEISCHNGELSTRLLLTADISETIPYVCLSHCWGGSSLTKLTEDVEESFFRDLPVVMTKVSLIRRSGEIQLVAWTLGPEVRKREEQFGANLVLFPWRIQVVASVLVEHCHSVHVLSVDLR